MIGEIEEIRERIEEEASRDEFGERGRAPMEEGSVGYPREILDRVFNYSALCYISSFPRLPGLRDLGPALFPLLLFFFSLSLSFFFTILVAAPSEFQSAMGHVNQHETT